MIKSDLDISQLLFCIKSLKQCSDDLKTINETKIKEYIEDACIKRFEYTVETAWKLMKKFLKLQYGRNDRELTMNNIFRLMESYGFILSWESWREYYAKRNDTSYEYSQKKAKEILNYVDDLIKDCEFLYNKLSEFFIKK